MSYTGMKHGGRLDRVEDAASSSHVAKFAGVKGTSLLLVGTEKTTRGERFLWSIPGVGAILSRRIDGKAEGGADLHVAHWIKGHASEFMAAHRGFVRPLI